jgi:uncharacterized membrane protein
MSASTAIAFWGLGFAGGHLVLSSGPVRSPLVARLGDRGFQGLYSLFALGTFAGLCWTWWGARHAGSSLWMLRDVPAMTPLALVLSVLGFALIVASFFQPSALGMVPGETVRATGLARITRHPLMMGLALWGISHLLMNGWASDVAFFGSLTALALLGAYHQDARKRAADDGTLATYFAESSVLPFAAAFTGRAQVVANELPWVGIATGVVVAVVLYWLHPLLFA